MSSGGAVEKCVDVACAGDFEFGEAGERGEVRDKGRHNFLGDDFWRLAEFAGQFECDGRGDFAETQIGRRLERDERDLKIVFFF